MHSWFKHTALSTSAFGLKHTKINLLKFTIKNEEYSHILAFLKEPARPVVDQIALEVCYAMVCYATRLWQLKRQVAFLVGIVSPVDQVNSLNLLCAG